MKREADRNRVKRAVEHLNAAVTNIHSIKAENMTRQENNALRITVNDIKWLVKRLTSIAENEN